MSGIFSHLKATLFLATGLSLVFPVAPPEPAPILAQIAPVRDGDDRWGINHVDGSPSSQRLARDAGARWNRWEFRWDTLESRAGLWDWAASDRMVEASTAAGLSVQGILISTPENWINFRTRIPDGLHRPWNDPRNYWGQWVHLIVSHYRGKIRHWEVWNEPDFAEVFWGASTADYYQLLKVAYQVIKSVDRNNQVLLGGLAYWYNPAFLEELTDLMMADPTARENRYYFDILVWHAYTRPSDVWDRVTQSRELLARTVGPRPIWVNEANVPAWEESSLHNFRPYPLSASLQEQAHYIIQSFAYAVAAGADKLFVYRFQDTEWPEAYGLLKTDGALRPAYTAFQVAARYLSHTRGVLARQGDVEQVIATRPGERVIVVWNRTPTRATARIGAAATTARTIDPRGVARPLRTTAGQYQLDLAPATAANGPHAGDYYIGGTPVIIVESVPEARARVEESSPVITYSGSWEPVGADGPSAGAVRRSAVAGAAAASDFEGRAITWITSRGPDRGIARVTVDGAPQGEIDLYNPTPVWDVPLTFGDFEPGPHRLTLMVTGNRSPASTDAFVDVDAFAADGLRAAPAAPGEPSAPATATPTRPPTRVPTSSE